jgi:hypothetical protein
MAVEAASDKPVYLIPFKQGNVGVGGDGGGLGNNNSKALLRSFPTQNVALKERTPFIKLPIISSGNFHVL